jgi:hypothetical protein
MSLGPEKADKESAIRFHEEREARIAALESQLAEAREARKRSQYAEQILVGLIRNQHLKFEVAEGAVVHWDRAWIDPGPSPAGNSGPYVKVPISIDRNEVVERVYPKAALWHKLDAGWVAAHEEEK